MEQEINPKIVAWFQTRGISLKTLQDTGIYSGRHQKIGDSFEVVRDLNGEVIVYPYYHNNEEVNAKYRAAQKKFYQKVGGYKTFFNSEVLTEEEGLKDGSISLIITEGENDALAVMECGIPHVVSVPDGAPPQTQHVVFDDIDPEFDTKYLYIHNNWDLLKPIRHIIIATDADEPGKRLAEELVRRLGRVRCQFIEYPNDCKDLNEVLLKYGSQTVNEVLRYAKPYPVEGIFTFSGLPHEPDLVPLSTGWGRLDAFIRPFFPAFMVITGTAGSGKSTWVNQLVAQMSILHGLCIGIASFEMRINPFVSEVLVNTFRDIHHRNTRNWQSPTHWLEESFVFICPEPGDSNNEFNIDWLIEKAEAAVIRYGIRILVVDPWNEIEHAVKRMENHSDYIGRAIRALKRFGREFDVLVIIVAHPSKYGANKPPEDITLYDVSDSAHFANKADFGVVIARVGISNETNVMIKKVRYQTTTGKLGMVPLTYDNATRTFSQ